MIYRTFALVEGQPQIYGLIDEDGKCRLTCTAENPEFKEWLEQGNTPLPVEEQQ